MQYISNFISYIFILFRLKKQISQQKEYVKREFNSLFIVDAPHSKQRMIIYSTYIPVFIGYSYTQLRKQKISPTEKKALTALGALTALVDDYFDDKNYEFARLQHLFNQPHINEICNSKEECLLSLYNIVITNTQHKKLCAELFEKILNAQTESKKQENNAITKREIEKITFNKGGFSMQLYRTAFENKIDKKELDFFYKIGAIGQFENDIFDIYKDHTDGIQTLCTKAKNISEIAVKYNSLQNDIFNDLNTLNFNTKHINLFKQFLMLIIKRGDVALNTYAKNLKTDELDLLNTNRHQLICDMEKPLNILKLIHYAASCRKK